jgi:Reverse transcriptase (RNA-dependent DNA polymerase)
MCSIGCKIYSKFLISQLDIFLPKLEDYQRGFLPNRSCDDLNFILRNILDQHWQCDSEAIIFSYDLSKAFDSVKIETLPNILLHSEVPHYLINRIIKSILTENNCLKWKGQYSQTYDKTKGIKQGCCASPRAFIIILNEAIKATRDELLNHNIVLCIGLPNEPLTLPLTYADDIYLITETIMQGQLISRVLLL